MQPKPLLCSELLMLQYTGFYKVLYSIKITSNITICMYGFFFQPQNYCSKSLYSIFNCLFVTHYMIFLFTNHHLFLLTFIDSFLFDH